MVAAVLGVVVVVVVGVAAVVQDRKCIVLKKLFSDVDCQTSFRLVFFLQSF